LHSYIFKRFGVLARHVLADDGEGLRVGSYVVAVGPVAAKQDVVFAKVVPESVKTCLIKMGVGDDAIVLADGALSQEALAALLEAEMERRHGDAAGEAAV